ncbi:GHMP kinase [Candidatus Woesearchaeota archaeon]|nr:GHMP kinase [Candidatus Woesearchaeota archaeon]
MISAKAFAPANISCVFKIHEHKNPRWMGSYGFGFTLNKGVIVEVSKAKRTEVVFNNHSISFPTVKSVVEELAKEKLRVYIKSELPLGCGFGLSGASALATAYAINKLLKLGKTNKELAVTAHTAEVENRTGLGDVVNQYYGGFCVKFKPSSYFIVEKITLNNINVYCKYFSKISTKSIITNAKIKNKINDAASIALDKIKQLLKFNKNIQLKQIIKISKEFAVNSKLLMDKKTIQIIREIEKNNGNASMIMLGNAVFSDKKFRGSIKLKISDRGAHLL